MDDKTLVLELLKDLVNTLEVKKDQILDDNDLKNVWIRQSDKFKNKLKSLSKDDRKWVEKEYEQWHKNRFKKEI